MRIGMTYVFTKEHNQSTLRNRAIKHIPLSTDYVSFIDSDIYVSRTTFKVCRDFLEKHKDIGAIAPPLVRYYGGKHSIVREKTAIRPDNRNIIMPSKLDFKTSSLETNHFVSSLLLRGAYIIRRDVLKQIFKDKPWIKHFKVWQNVPFFLTLKENGITFGYLKYWNTICLHDERPHKETLRNSMKDWLPETLKSIILLFFRNQLWLPTYYHQNTRFITTIKGVLTSLHLANDIEIIKQIAKTIAISKSYKKDLKELSKKIKDQPIQKAIKLIMNVNKQELSAIQSDNLKVTM
jgi:hypothetical protein